MKQFCLSIVALIFSLFGLIAHGSMGNVEISGIITSFDKTSVTIKQTQQSVKVPKKYIQQKELKIGTQVVVRLTSKEFNELVSTNGIGN